MKINPLRFSRYYMRGKGKGLILCYGNEKNQQVLHLYDKMCIINRNAKERKYKHGF